MAKSSTLTLSYRWQVLQRVVAAIVAGYALSASLSALLAQLLPMAEVHAVAVASMLSFTLYTAIIIGCFAVRRLRTLWCALLLSLLLSTGVSCLIANPALINAALINTATGA